MIVIQDLKKSFRTEEVETLALNNVNLTVEDGEFVAIMGPSGCGKSTLLNIIGMLDNPTEGSYNFAGHEVAGLKESQRTQLRKGNLGFVFQSFNLIDELTVYEKCRIASYLFENGKSGAQGKSNEGIGAYENSAPRKALSSAVIRWSTTTSGYFESRSNESKINFSG